MTTKYFAIDAAGQTHTRTTKARGYTHTVVAQRSKEQAIRDAHARRGRDLSEAREQFDCAGRTIEQLKAWFISKRCEILARNDDYAIERQTKGKAFVAQWGTPEAYADHQLAERLAEIEATDWSVWINQGWCGRPDLARNLQANCTKGGTYHNATILPAQVKA